MYYVFRFITSVWTYVVVFALLIVGIVFGTTAKHIFSFRWVPAMTLVNNTKIWSSNQVRDRAIGNFAVQIAYTNMSLGHSKASSQSSKDIPSWDTIEQSLQLSKMLEEFRRSTLDNIESPSKDFVLEDSIAYGNKLLSLWSTLLQSLQLKIVDHRAQAELCISKKTQADDLYNQSLKNYDSASIRQATTQAQEANACIWQQSTLANSYKGVYDTLQKESNRSSGYIKLLESNKELFLRYGEVLGTQVPQQLLRLQQDLRRL